METFHNATNWWVKDDSVIPRAFAWDDGQKFEKYDYDLLFGTNQIVHLMPTGDNFTRSIFYFVSKGMVLVDNLFIFNIQLLRKTNFGGE